MPNKKYTYDFPEQRELCSDLLIGDHIFIAMKVGLSPSHISNQCKGIRKMNPKVEWLIKEINKFRKFIDEHLLEESVSEN